MDDQLEEYEGALNEDAPEGKNIFIQEDSLDITDSNAPADSPADLKSEPYRGEDYYKEQIRLLKNEYKVEKKERKKAERLKKELEDGSDDDGKSSRGGSHTVLTVILSSVITVAICAIVFTLLFAVPNTKDSYFAHLCKKYCLKEQEKFKYSQPSQHIGEHTIEPGSNITIEVNGECSVPAVYAKTSNSVVGVEVRALSGRKWETVTETVVGQGSGVVYSSDGQILTNCHVIADAMNASTRAIDSNFKIVVYLDTSLSHGYTVTNVIGYDEACDIAILKIDAEGLTPIEFGDSDALSVGESVVAIGSPGGLEFMNSVSEGVISGLQRNITSSSTGNTIYDLIQTTAAINPGNSGGALLNAKGELVGICVIKIVDTNYEGMGFAISSNSAKMIAESIIKYGRYVKAVIGVTVDTAYTRDSGASKGWPSGAFVVEVTPDGAADKAGVRADDIICELDGMTVSSYDDLRRLLTHYSPDDSVNIKVFRISTEEFIDMTVVLSAS